MTTEIEVLDQPLTRREVVERLASLGLQPSEIGAASGVPVTVVRTIIRRHVVEDPELESAWRNIELMATREIARIIRRGPHNDRVAMLKIVAGRVLSKRAGNEPDTEIEELRAAWNDLRDESRSVPLESGADVIDAFPVWDEDDDDE